MLCKEGQKLKEELAKASVRFSDYPEAGVKQMRGPDRVTAEKFHVEQQETLRAFTQHVEECSVCGRTS